jgi:hypothetical protein
LVLEAVGVVVDFDYASDFWDGKGHWEVS